MFELIKTGGLAGQTKDSLEIKETVTHKFNKRNIVQRESISASAALFARRIRNFFNFGRTSPNFFERSRLSPKLERFSIAFM